MSRWRRMKRRASTKRLRDFFSDDSTDGIKCHRIKEGRKISAREHKINWLDSDRIVEDVNNKFRELGAIKQARKFNSYKCRNINSYKKIVDGGNQ